MVSKPTKSNKIQKATLHLRGALNKSANLMSFLTLLGVVLIFHPDAYDAYMDPKDTLLVFSGIMIFALVVILAIGFRLNQLNPWFLLLLALFFIANRLSLVAAVNVRESFLQLLRLSVLIAISVWASLAVRSRLQTLKLLGLLSIAAVIVTSYGFFQFAGYDFIDAEVKRWPVSTIGNLNFAAQFLIAAIPLLFAGMLISRPNASRILFFLALSLAIIHLLLTKSRGGYLGFIIGLTLFLILLHKTGRTNLKELFYSQRAKILATAAGIIIVLATFIYMDRGDILNQARTIVLPGKDTNRYRLLTWRDTLRMVGDSPLTGVGIGNFRFVFPRYRSEQLLAEQNIFGTIRQIRTHNDYLNLLAETGILGFAAFFALLIYLLKCAIHHLKHSTRQNLAHKRYLFIGATSAIAATLTQSLFDFNLYNPASGLLFWLCVGILCQKSPLEKPHAKNIKSQNPWLLAILISLAAVLMIAVCFVCTIALRNYVVSVLNKAGYGHVRSGNYADAISYLRQAHQFDSQNINSAALLADALRKNNELREAARVYEEWINLEPNYSPALNRLGYCYVQLKIYDKAEHSFRRALEINPHNSAAFNNLANLYFILGEYEKAVALYERAAEKNDQISRQSRPNYAETLYILKRYDDALALYQQLHEQLSADLHVLNRLIDCYQKTGKMDEAEKHIKRLRILEK